MHMMYELLADRRQNSNIMQTGAQACNSVSSPSTAEHCPKVAFTLPQLLAVCTICAQQMQCPVNDLQRIVKLLRCCDDVHSHVQLLAQHARRMLVDLSVEFL